MRAGIGPAHSCFADSRVSTSPTHHGLYFIMFLIQSIEKKKISRIVLMRMRFLLIFIIGFLFLSHPVFAGYGGLDAFERFFRENPEEKPTFIQKNCVEKEPYGIPVEDREEFCRRYGGSSVSAPVISRIPTKPVMELVSTATPTQIPESSFVPTEIATATAGKNELVASVQERFFTVFYTFWQRISTFFLRK